MKHSIIVELLEKSDTDFRLPGQHHHVTSGWIGLDCPWCGETGKFHLAITFSGDRANCWKCGSKSPASVLHLVCGIRYDQAKKITEEALSDESFFDPSQKISGTLKNPKTLKPLSNAHRSYLLNRGYNPSAIEKLWSVKGICQHPSLGWRLFIPVFNRYGEQVTWTTRSIVDGSKRKYRSARTEESKESIKNILYGVNLARQAIVIVEGPLDVWAIGPGAVATCGTSFTQQQLLEMSKYPLRVVCFDTDEAGQSNAKKLIMSLKGMPGRTINVKLESGNDPSSADPCEIREIRKRFLSCSGTL